MKQLSRNIIFGGELLRFEHDSSACNAPMRFAIYLPPQVQTGSCPVVYWLSGLTCNEENFMLKSGAQRAAAQLGMILVAPDTSPRDTGTPGEDDDWDIGSGAGFYINATQAPWSNHYRMYDYVTDELPALIESNFPADGSRRCISGHSMGGHGALVVALRNPDRYRSVSAFAPICAPGNCPWGRNAFENYLGDNEKAWADYDACKLVASGRSKIPLLVDQGTDDEFLDNQLMPARLESVCVEYNHDLTLRYQPGYDHSHYFVASFIDDHLRHHADACAS